MNNLIFLSKVYNSNTFEKLNLKPSQTLVLIGLLFHYNADSKSCFPQQRALSNRLNLTRESVNRAIISLEKLGIINAFNRLDKPGLGKEYYLTQDFIDLSLNQITVSQFKQRREEISNG